MFSISELGSETESLCLVYWGAGEAREETYRVNGIIFFGNGFWAVASSVHWCVNLFEWKPPVIFNQKLYHSSCVISNILIIWISHGLINCIISCLTCVRFDQSSKSLFILHILIVFVLIQMIKQNYPVVFFFHVNEIIENFFIIFVFQLFCMELSEVCDKLWRIFKAFIIGKLFQ